MNIYCFSTLSFAKLQFKSVINKAFHKHGVASFTDAWIETLNIDNFVKAATSHLLQMRGLKLWILQQFFNLNVASFTDAWIETISEGVIDKPETVASFTDAWIETFAHTHTKDADNVASFTDAWIETEICALRRLTCSCRIFYRCVD